jgi:hypothetical protein
MKIDVQELLKGMRPLKDEDGNIVVQSINNMQIVCLTTDAEYDIDKFANPLALSVDTERSYGHLTIHNEESKPAIVLPQATYLTKKAAQDHAMVKAGYVPSSSARDFDDACCVESTQGGYIHKRDEVRGTVLPYYLREASLQVVGQDSYGKIWPSIGSFNNSVSAGMSSRQHISDYFKKYDKKLEQFIAHFEKPKQCIGAIVLVAGEIVAIDKFPSFVYTDQVWDTLIRDCYGSIAITEEIKSVDQDKRFTTLSEKSKKKAGEPVGDYLRKILNKTKKSIEDDVKERIEEIFDVEFTKKIDSSKDGYKSEILESEGYIGQVISESGYNHLVSIVKRSAFDAKRLRKASEMRNKAKSQDRFSL